MKMVVMKEVRWELESVQTYYWVLLLVHTTMGEY